MGLFNRLLERKPKQTLQPTEEIPQIADKDMEELQAPQNETQAQQVQREWNEYSEAQRKEAARVYERNIEVTNALRDLENEKNVFFKYFDQKYQALKKELGELNNKISEIEPAVAAYHAKKTYEKEAVTRAESKRAALKLVPAPQQAQELEMRNFGEIRTSKPWVFKRLLKPALAVGALLTVLGLTIREGVAHLENFTQFGEKVQELAGESSAPKVESTAVSPEEAQLASQAAEKIDARFTQFVKEKKQFSAFSELCGQELPDGTSGLDADKCLDMFGNQLNFNQATVIDTIAAPEGLTGAELTLRGKILRGSIISDTDKALSFGSGLKIPFYLEGDNIPGSLQKEKQQFFAQEYARMQDLAGLIVTETNLTAQDSETQKEIISAAQQALGQQLKLDVKWLAVGADIKNQGEELSFRDLSTGLPEPGKSETSAVSQISKLKNLAKKTEQAYLVLDNYLAGAAAETQLSDLFISAELAKEGTCWQLASTNGQHEDFWRTQLAELAEKSDTAN